VSIPRIRSESPAFDLHHPEIAEMELVEQDLRTTGVGAGAHEGDRP
jgi:cytochrome c oxidase subunit 1